MPTYGLSPEFETFYLRHFEMVYRICFLYMKNQHDAEDCTEDVFVKVYKGDYDFPTIEQEKAWLSITAMNLCKDRLKHWWNRRVTYDDVDEASLAAPTEKRDDTLEEVMKLPTKYKDVVYMYYYMGYSTDDIALSLNKPASTVRNLLRDARGRLKTMLGDGV